MSTADHNSLIASRDHLRSQARERGFRLAPLDVPPADPAAALIVEIALCRAALGRKAGPQPRVKAVEQR